MIRQLVIRRKGKALAVIPCHRKFRCARRAARRMARDSLPRWQIAMMLGIKRAAVDRLFEAVI